MEWNSKFKCPSCSFGGQKDDACTHMECDCGVNWCYFCQQALPTNMFDHNADWHACQTCCPLFLEELHEFDSTWAEDQAGCMEKLHRLVCLKKLKQLDIDVLKSRTAASNHHDPPPTLDDLFVAFPGSFPPGYSINDI